LHDRLATTAGFARANEPVHDKSTRNVFQFLGDILAQRPQAAATIGAGLAWRKLALVARQACRQRLAFGLFLALFAIFRLGRPGTRDLGLFQGQIELIRTLGCRAEAIVNGDRNFP